MNIINQSPGKGNIGRSVFPAPMAPPRPSSSSSGHPHHHHHQDHVLCQHLLPPVALPLQPPASHNHTMRCLQPSRSTCIAPLVVDANGGSPHREEPTLIHRSSADHGPGVVKAQCSLRMRRRSSAAVAGSLEDICNQLPNLPDGSSGAQEQHLELPADAATAHYHLFHPLTEEVERGSPAAGHVGFEPLSSTLDFVPSLMGDDKFSLIQQEYHHHHHAAAGGHIDRRQQLLAPEEPPSDVVVTLAVSVWSAVKLESKQMGRIAKKMRRLTGFENLRLENTVDPSLIAGFVIRYGVGDAHVIDLSVKGRLAELEARLESSDQSTGNEGWNFPGMH